MTHIEDTQVQASPIRRSACGWAISVVLCSCSLQDYSYLGDGLSVANHSGGSTSTKATVSVGGGGANGTEGFAGTDRNTQVGGSTAAIQTSTNSGGTGAGSSGGTTTFGSSNGGTGRGGTSSFAAAGSNHSSSAGSSGGASSASGGSSASASNGSGGVSSFGGKGGSGVTSKTGGAGSSSTGGASSSSVNASGGSSATSSSNANAGSAGATGGITCSGCAVLDVPFTAKGQSARYFMKYSPAVTVNEHTGTGVAGGGAVLNAGKLKARLYAPRLGNSTYQLMIQQDSGGYDICTSPTSVWPTEVTSTWVTVEWSLEACPLDTAIGRLAITLLAPATTDAAGPGRATIWLDAMWIELNGKSIAGPFNFDNSNSINPVGVANDWAQVNGILYLRPNTPTPPTGSSLAWTSG